MGTRFIMKCAVSVNLYDSKHLHEKYNQWNARVVYIILSEHRK